MWGIGRTERQRLYGSSFASLSLTDRTAIGCRHNKATVNIKIKNKALL